VKDYESIQRRRNVIVGVFVVVAVCALVWLIFKFRDLPSAFGSVRSYQVRVQFPSAPGVQRDTPVRFCGYQIGRVAMVTAPQVCRDLNTGLNYHQTVVVLSIRKQYNNIPSNVSVKLMTRGLGSSYIELVVDPAALPAPPLDPNVPESKFLFNGMLLQGSSGQTSEFFPEESQRKLDELVQGLRSLIGSTNAIIGDPNNRQNINKTLANLSEATRQATVTMEKVEQAVEEFRTLAVAGTSTLKNADAGMEKLVVTMLDTSEGLSKTMAELRVILGQVSDGQGTVGKLVSDGRLYENLVDASTQLQVLLQELTSLTDEVKKKGLRSIY
jgi:phospholipid/cholesterol/gamma-HCH transport system substrate-binding protein